MYDAIIVGARCAGSPLAMLLARQGHNVLLVDKAMFPSDTVSTHGLKMPAVARLQEWNLLDQVLASNCPPFRTHMLDVGPFTLTGTPAGVGEVDFLLAPRRRILDALLVEAAVVAGAEVRERFTVEGLVIDDGRVTGVRGHVPGGATVTEHATIVIGADGRHSQVAKAVNAPYIVDRGAFCCGYYSYFSDVPCDSIELYPRPGRMLVAFPTNDNATLVFVLWPRDEFQTVRADIEGHFMRSLDLAPNLAERVRGGQRAERWNGTADLPNYQRQAFGPGWALAGDALSHKDPVLAQGISDAFHDATLLSETLHAALSGLRPMDEALADYQRRHLEVSMPLFEMTCEFAALQPPPPHMQQLLGALIGNQPAINQFMGTINGTVPLSEFYAPENMARLTGATV
jgi:2-polyprenyl-6-methoxyphenol hydroxylase-like FAD-dependent oxidoreductase